MLKKARYTLPPMPPSRARTSLPLTNDSEQELVIPRYDEANLAKALLAVSRNHLAEEITGGLAHPSKMPCPSWGISAARCKVGSVLANEPGTVCSYCYALRGRYLWSTTQAKLEQRYRGLAHKLWTPAMCFLIGYQADKYFRFFDSGDLQDENHLHNICIIARYLSDVLFWLPTREYELVRSFDEDIPENLRIRVSAQRIDGAAPKEFHYTSTVGSHGKAPPDEDSFQCVAPSQNNQCGRCRECWSDTKNVHYVWH